MRKAIFAHILLLFLLLPLSAGAVSFNGGEDFSLSPSDVHEGDLFVGAGTVVISGTVNGDLYAAGGNIAVTGTVTGDLHLAGGNIRVSGTVNEDARIVGGNAVFEGIVSGDLIVVGGDLTLENGSRIGDDLLMAGGNARIAGSVVNESHVFLGKLVAAGEFNDIQAEIGEEITLTRDAVVHGSLKYSSPQEAFIDEGAEIEGLIDFTPTPQDVGKALNFLPGAFFVLSLIISLVTALLVVFLFKQPTERLLESANNHTAPNLFYGIIALFIVPILSILLIVSGIGSVIGIMGLALYVLLLLMAFIMSGPVFGSYFLRLFKKPYGANLQTTVLGVALLYLIIFIPLIGWVARVAIFILTLGALSDLFIRFIKKIR